MGRVSGYITRSGKRVRSYTRRTGSGRSNFKTFVTKGISTKPGGRISKRKRSGGGARVGNLQAGSVIKPRHRRNRVITGTSGQAITSSKHKRKSSGVTASLRRQARGGVPPSANKGVGRANAATRKKNRKAAGDFMADTAPLSGSAPHGSRRPRNQTELERQQVLRARRRSWGV